MAGEINLSSVRTRAQQLLDQGQNQSNPAQAGSLLIITQSISDDGSLKADADLTNLSQAIISAGESFSDGDRVIFQLASATLASLVGLTQRPVQTSNAAVLSGTAPLSQIPALIAGENHVDYNVVTVVGAGKMGSDIAYALLMGGYKVRLWDEFPGALEKSQSYILELIQKGLKYKKFSKQQADMMVANLKLGESLSDAVKGSGYVLEAIFENFEAKKDLFTKLGKVAHPDTIFMTNTSTLSVQDLAAASGRPTRFIGTHYFWPAYRNAFLEITPADEAEPEAVALIDKLARRAGKIAIHTPDIPGFVANRFFVPWLNEGGHLLDHIDGWGVTNLSSSEKMILIDHVAKVTFGIGLGPFGLMNVTGPMTTYDSTLSLAELGDYYKPAPQIAALVKNGTDRAARWDYPGKEDMARVEDEVLATISEKLTPEQLADLRGKIADRLKAVAFRVASKLAEDGVSIRDIDLSAKVALAWPKGPFEMMNDMGIENARDLVNGLDAPGLEEVHIFETPGLTRFPVSSVNLTIENGRARISIDRPSSLNALDPQVVADLREAFEKANSDDAVTTIIFEGLGGHLAGADIGFFVRNLEADNLQAVLDFAGAGQQLLKAIEQSKKTTVTIIDGFALGGGMELALATKFRIATQKAVMGLPETTLGIIPGLMGGSRLAQLTSVGLAFWMQATGIPSRGAMLEKMGLVDIGNIPSDQIDEAVERLLTNQDEYRAQRSKRTRTGLERIFEHLELREAFIERDLDYFVYTGEDSELVELMKEDGLIRKTAANLRSPREALVLARLMTSNSSEKDMQDSLNALFRTPMALSRLQAHHQRNPELVLDTMGFVENDWSKIPIPDEPNMNVFEGIKINYLVDRGPILKVNLSSASVRVDDLDLNSVVERLNRLDEMGKLAGVARVDFEGMGRRTIERIGVAKRFAIRQQQAARARMARSLL